MSTSQQVPLFFLEYIVRAVTGWFHVRYAYAGRAICGLIWSRNCCRVRLGALMMDIYNMVIPNFIVFPMPLGFWDTSTGLYTVLKKAPLSRFMLVR